MKLLFAQRLIDQDTCHNPRHKGQQDQEHLLLHQLQPRHKRGQAEYAHAGAQEEGLPARALAGQILTPGLNLAAGGTLHGGIFVERLPVVGVLRHPNLVMIRLRDGLVGAVEQIIAEGTVRIDPEIVLFMFLTRFEVGLQPAAGDGVAIVIEPLLGVFDLIGHAGVGAHARGQLHPLALRAGGVAAREGVALGGDLLLAVDRRAAVGAAAGVGHGQGRRAGAGGGNFHCDTPLVC